MGGATHDGDAKTGVELPGEYKINLKLLLNLCVLSVIARFFFIFIQLSLTNRIGMLAILSSPPGGRAFSLHWGFEYACLIPLDQQFVMFTGYDSQHVER